MSALVSYDSSSDEDGARPAPKQDIHAIPQVNGNAGNSGGPSAVSIIDPSAPMVGPSMPTDSSIANGDLTEPEDGLLDLDLHNLSEQDLVRHLTQTSHPMKDLPESPPGSPNPAVEARFKKFLELKAQGLHFNEDLAKKPSFKNPALLKTLVERMGVDEQSQHASSLPGSIWDPASLPPQAYKEELAKNQQSIRDSEWARKRNEAKGGIRKIEFHSAQDTNPSSQPSTPGSGRNTTLS